MRFELLHALRGLDERTQPFFKTEALSDSDQTARRAAVEALRAVMARSATALLKEKLRLT